MRSNRISQIIHYTATARYYTYLSNTRSYASAMQACINQGMQLATVIDQNDVDAVIITGIPTDTYLWFGLLRNASIYQWLDGTVQSLSLFINLKKQ